MFAGLRVSYEPGLGGQTHMARDRMLLLSCPAARVYTWDGPWVTLGRFQKPSDALIPSCRLPWAARPTGGRAVMHGHDVTVGMALPLHKPSSVRQVYPAIVGLLVESLRQCGVQVSLARDLLGEERAQNAPDCFATISPNDIVDQFGNKVCGCALRLTDKSVLVQASIPFGQPLIDLGEVYWKPAPVNPIHLDAANFAKSLEEVLNSWAKAETSLAVR